MNCPVCSHSAHPSDRKHYVLDTGHIYIFCLDCSDVKNPNFTDGRVNGPCYVVGTTQGGWWGGAYFDFRAHAETTPKEFELLMVEYRRKKAAEEEARKPKCAVCGKKQDAMPKIIYFGGKHFCSDECYAQMYPDRAKAEAKQLALCKSGKCSHGPHSKETVWS